MDLHQEIAAFRENVPACHCVACEAKRVAVNDAVRLLDACEAEIKHLRTARINWLESRLAEAERLLNRIKDVSFQPVLGWIAAYFEKGKA